MTILDAILQGIIQGLTEFLPVSSSGHLSLFQHFTGIQGEEAVFTTIALHIGTLIAVFIAFKEKIWQLILEALQMIKDVFTGKFSWEKMNADRRMIMMIIISILPLFIFYIFKDFFTSVSSDNDVVIEGICFLYTAGLLTIGDRCSKRSSSFGAIGKTAGETTVPDALFIGFFQGIALLPGVSRSGSTISSGLIAGQKREDAVEYSFILGIPVIIAGALSELLELGNSDESFEAVPLLVGMAVAAVSGYLAIVLVKWLMKSNRFSIFAVYTFILGLIVIGVGAYEHISGNYISQLFT